MATHNRENNLFYKELWKEHFTLSMMGNTHHHHDHRVAAGQVNHNLAPLSTIVCQVDDLF